MSADAGTDWVDALLPAIPPPEVDAFARIQFRTDGATSLPGPGDQVLASILHAYLARRITNEHLVVQLPRGRQDIATLLAVFVQVLRANIWDQRGWSHMAAFSGPVVVVGTDSAVQRRLRDVQVQGANLRGGLAEGLSACRVRSDGSVVTPSGTIASYEGGDRRLLYLNTRVGWPDITFQDAVGLLDRTTMTVEAYQGALDFLAARRTHHSTTVTFVGDTETLDVLNRAGHTPRVWAMTPGVLADIHYSLGSGKGNTSLTTNALLTWKPSWSLHLVDDPAVNKLVDQAFWALGHVNVSDRRPPRAVQSASSLVSALIRCPVDISEYSRAAAVEPYVSSPKSLARTLELRDTPFYGHWAAFQTAYWGSLRAAALGLYHHLTKTNPKTAAVLDAVDLIRRTQPASRIIVRVSNGATVPLLQETLHRARLNDGRISIEPWSRNLRWKEADVEIWSGAPPWAHRSHVFSAETQDKIAVCYQGEAVVLRKRTHQMLEAISDNVKATSSWLGLTSIASETATWNGPTTPRRIPHGTVSLDVDLTRVADRLSSVLADSGEASLSRQTAESSSDEEAELIPVFLSNGHVWWLNPQRAVGVLVDGHYCHRLARELHPGDQLVVPRGEGRDEIFGRLVQAAHRRGDVSDLDVLLGRFRIACRSVWEECDRNWAEVKRRLEAVGAHAVNQTKSWAEGSTIAPEDPEDVRRIGELAGDRHLVNSWATVAAIASEIRSLHSRLGRSLSQALGEVAARRPGSGITRLEEVLGPDAIEVLDEFIIMEATKVGDPESVSARVEGQVLTNSGGNGG